MCCYTLQSPKTDPKVINLRHHPHFFFKSCCLGQQEKWGSWGSNACLVPSPHPEYQSWNSAMYDIFFLPKPRFSFLTDRVSNTQICHLLRFGGRDLI